VDSALGIRPYDFHIVPQGQDLYCIVYNSDAPSLLLKIPREFFANVADDGLVVDSGEDDVQARLPAKGALYLVHRNDTAFQCMRITDFATWQLEHAVFAPAISQPVHGQAGNGRLFNGLE
jgi:hypothetical protein